MRDWRAEIRRRLAAARLQPSKENEIVDEIAQHLDDRAQDLRARGKTPAEIETALLAELDDHEVLARGLKGLAAAPEPIVPGARGGAFLGDLLRDVRYAVRALLKTPGFTVVTLLSLALGIGANVAIFQLVDAVQLRTLPVDGAETLASIRIHDRKWASGDFTGYHPDLSYPIFERVRDQQQAFTGVFAFSERRFNLAPGGEANWTRALFTSGDYFRILNIKPALGRLYTAADDQRGCTDPGLVLGYGFWQRELGGDPSVVGRELTLDGHPVHVIGVAAQGFVGLEVGRSFDVAIPLCMERLLLGSFSYTDKRYGWWLAAMGRLKPGWTIEKANAQIAAISKGIIEDTVPEAYPPDSVKKYLEYKLEAVPAATGISFLRRDYTTPLYFLLATAGLVLLIACANLANLLLARASAREREIAVRLAIGASRGRLVRQLMTESLLLAVVGTGIGLLLARFLDDFMVAFLSTQRRPIVINVDPDWRVIGFAVGLAVLTCLLFGLFPALRASRTDVGLVLKTTTTTAGKERFGLRRTLVAVQVALSFVLLVGALLFARTLGNLASVDPGFNDDGVVILSADLRPLKLSAERKIPTARELLTRIRDTPGVAAAATVSVVPISGNGWDNFVWLDGKSNTDLDCNFDRVSNGYFDAMQTRVVAGRDFDDRDTMSGPPVTIINQVLAEKLDPGGGSPIGKRMRMSGTPGGDAEKVFEIVGVVANSKYRELREDFTPIAYFPDGQDDDPPPVVQYLVRGAGPLTAVVPAIKKTVADLSPALVMDFDLLDRQISTSVTREKLMATLAGFFGVLAALLATIGLYGVISYSVARRTHEIGIRMALGADSRRVAKMIVGEAAKLLGVGLIAGIVLALIGGRAATAMLYGLAAHDPLTFFVAIVLMTAIAFLASFLPARRAARVHPMSALREE